MVTASFDSNERAIYDSCVMTQIPLKLSKDPILASLLERLKKSLDPERIYLFGSQARGGADSDSDYDFLVVVSHSDKPRYQRNSEAYLALCGIGVAKDVIVLTHKEFESSRRTVASLTSTVLGEGILLHEAGNEG